LVFVVDRYNNRIVMLRTETGELIGTFGSFGSCFASGCCFFPLSFVPSCS
jgi:hypothetical protein